MSNVLVPSSIDSPHWLTWLMEPASDAQKTRVFMRKTYAALQIQASFMTRHFELANYGCLAWITSFFDTLTFSMKALKDCILCVLELHLEEAYEAFKTNARDTLSSLKLVALMPFCIFAGMFFPDEVFGKFHYNIEPTSSEQIAQLNQRVAQLSVQLDQTVAIRDMYLTARDNQIHQLQRDLGERIVSTAAIVNTTLTSAYHQQIHLLNSRIQELTMENLELIRKNDLATRREEELRTRTIPTLENQIATFKQEHLEMKEDLMNKLENVEFQLNDANIAAQAVNADFERISKKNNNFITWAMRQKQFIHNAEKEDLFESISDLREFFIFCQNKEGWNDLKRNARFQGKIDFEAIEGQFPLV